ncbi:nucleotidyltransferase family protein [Cohnella sp. REN36]|uniref:nucleotidyltransferase family protein n=1 Tax=Cohnella sp. REN36 TaxID=2887347 RepID=UPI001D159F0B|nr:nucleotidyltransferase family protein [Cohnella sp. REN36]MCC3375078.1 nucleotidyltransferase family protein [Cohnella sp. REN36]
MAANGNLRASVNEALIALPALQVSDFERNLMAVGYLTAVFEAEGIRPIIVGGHAIETYTQGFYTTKDVDLVLRGRADALDILRELGFQQYHDLRHWYFPQLRLPIEIVDSDLAGSEERLLRVQLPNNLHIYVIGIEGVSIMT